MTLRSRKKVQGIAIVSLLAAFTGAHTACAAEEVKLFPKRQATSAPREEWPELGAPASTAANEPVVEQPAQGSGPLRVVIPNIKQEQKKPIAAPANATASNAGTAEKVSAAIADSAQEAWKNGVMALDRGQSFLQRTIFKPNLPFAALPLEWRMTPPSSLVARATENGNLPPVAMDARAIANLAPAAGTPTTVPPPPPIIPGTTPEAAAQPAPPPVAQAATAPAASPAPASSEPAPALSTQSKNIASKITQAADPKPKETARKVDIDRDREIAGDVLNKDPAPNEAAGVKSKTERATLDVNYELERAYNALLAGKSDIAAQIYEDILTGNPKNKDALFGLASTYHRAGQIDRARTLYGKLLEVDPKHRDGLNNFLVLLADEAPQEALSQMERLESQNPAFSPIPAQMAIIYQKLGEREKAVDKMYRALSLAPENITYRYNLAIMLDKSGKYDQAEPLYAQILDASAKGEVIPGDAKKIQQRLTFIRSNSRK